MKRAFIIHGWEGFPEEGWFPWLKKELEKKGFEAIVPAMPETGRPSIERWVGLISKLVKKADTDTYFVGHSIGNQAILRYLQTIKEKIGGAVFVAGWVSLTTLAMPTDAEKWIAKQWLETPIDFEKARKTTNNFIAIYSDNDPYVTLDNSKVFEEKLGAKIIIEKGKGHFSGEDGITELPVVLDELSRLISERL